jgi:hypothetical protein
MHESPADSPQSTDQCGANACDLGRMGILAGRNPSERGNAVEHGDAVEQECPTDMPESNKVLGLNMRWTP